MIDPERIQRLAAKMGDRKDALEFVRQMRCGGNTFETGGPTGSIVPAIITKLSGDARKKYLEDYARSGYVYSYPDNPIDLIGYVASPYAKISNYGNMMLNEMPEEITNARRELFARNFGIDSSGEDYDGTIVESRYKPTVSSDADSRYYTVRGGARARFDKLQHILGNAKFDFGEDEGGKYMSVYDVWDLAPFTRKGNEFKGTTPVEIYDRFYESEAPELYSDPAYREKFTGARPIFYSCGGKKYPDGGKFFRTTLQNESPMMYQPMKPWMPDVSVPMRFVPEPDLGDYVPPSSTGMAENYPITVSVPSVRPDIGFVAPEIAEDAVDLFSDEARARRRLKQAYTESRFKKNAESEAGARGLFQIMPITEQDYLGRGRGKKGDIWNEGYNGGIRDWVMGIIPGDLQEFWSDDDSDINKLAKLYAAYNWGAGNLRKFFRARLDAGLSNDDPYEWVEAIQNKGKRKDETKNYVKFLALDQDIPDSYMTNEKFENAARSRGYMAEGGPKKSLFDPKKVAERVPGDGAYDGGTRGVLDAIRNYRKNDDRYVQDRLEAAMDDAAEGHLHTDELSSMLMHEDAKRIYLGLPQLYGSLEPSPYRPTIGKMDNPYQVNALLSDREFEDAILPMWATWKSGQDWPAYDTGWRVKDLGMTAQLTDFPYLHNAGMSEGYDDNGQYISLQDVWDYNTSIVGKGKDNIAKWVGGKPFDIYQRYYLDDWLDIPEEARGNPYIAPSYIEADYTGYKNGGRIHIKPENRGKFTALKERTGHSASWFRAHGTPAQKKMAVFALNAKKWNHKHGEGGFMNKYDGETEPTGQMDRVPNWVVRGQDYSEWNPGDIQEIINWGYTDPYSFFGVEGESTREALSRAGMADSVIADIYRNAPADLQEQLGDRYKGTAQRQDEYNHGIRDYTNYVAPRLGAVMAGSLLGAEGLYYLPEIYGALSSFPGAIKNVASDAWKWFSTPEGVRQAYGLGMSLVGGAAVDESVRRHTPYSSWGDALYAPIRRASDYVDEKIGIPTPEWMHRGNEFALDFTNPGYYATGLVEPVTRGISNAVKSGAEKVRMALGRSPEYENILKRMSEIERESASLERQARSLEPVATAEPGHYELPVTTVTEPFGSSSSGSLASTRDIEFVTSQSGDRVPVRQVIDDIGLTVGGQPEVTYPVPSTSVNPADQKVVFFRQYDPHPRPSSFSTVSGKIMPMAQDAEKKPISLVWDEGARRGQRPDDVLKLKMNSSASIPVQRGVRGAGKAVKESLARTESMLGDAGFVAGSTPLYAEDLLSGVPGDTEIVATRKSFPDVVDRLKIKSPRKINEFAYNGTSPLLPGTGEVDIQLIEENANGEAVGGLAWSYFRNLHPLEYNALLDHYAHVKPNTPYKELPVINPQTGVAYTPEQLASEAKGNRLQHIVDEAMGMNRDIRRIWSSHGSQLDKTLKYNRAIGLMTNKDPMVKQMVRKAIDTNAKAELGQYYVHGSEYFPNIDFANVEANKAFLKKFNINPDGIADDPEMMRNIFDMWFLTECSQVRLVKNMNGYRAMEDALFMSNHAYTGGDYSGSGLNTLKAGVNEGGMPGKQRGIMQVPLSIKEPPSEIASVEDAVNFTKRLARDVRKGETPRIISDKEYKALTDELDNIINEFSSRYVSGESNFDLDGIIVELKNQKRQFGNVKSLRRLDDFFRTIGRYPDPYSKEVIDRMARSIDMPGMFTSGYDNTYFGKLISGRPSASTIKVVDPNVERGTGFEVGKLLDSYAVDPITLNRYSGNSGMLSGWEAANKLMGSMGSTVPGYGGTFVDAVVRSVPTETVEEMGARFVRSPQSKQYIETLDDLSRLAHEYENLTKRAEELEKFSKSGKAIENAEANTRYSREFMRHHRTGVQRILSANEKRGIREAIKKNQSLHGDEKVMGFHRNNDGTIEIILINGEHYTYSPVTRQIEDATLPFALGGYINKINSKYGNDPDKIRQIFTNVRSRQKK